MVYSGCPAYDWSTQSTPNAAQVNAQTSTVPTMVKLCQTPYSIGLEGEAQPQMGALGVSLEGVALYGPTDDELISANSDQKGRNALVFEGKSLGVCGSHCDASGGFHYHAHPGIPPADCTTPCSTNDEYGCNHKGWLCAEEIPTDATVCSAITEGDGAWYDASVQLASEVFPNGGEGSHSLLLGFMLDGIPIYGLLNSAGAVPSDLDSCGGHDSDLGFYHYHAQGVHPYLIGCFKGKPYGLDTVGKCHTVLSPFSRLDFWLLEEPGGKISATGAGWIW